MKQHSQLLLVSLSWIVQLYPSICHSVVFLTHMDPENRKMNHVSKGLNHNIANRNAEEPRWQTMKLLGQAWNSLGDYYLNHAWHFMKISWKSTHPFFHSITKKHGSRKQKNRSWIQEVNHNIPKKSQFVPCLMCKLCWKFHGIHSSVIL